MATCAVHIICVCLQNIWEAKNIWTPGIHIHCKSRSQSSLYFYIWHYNVVASCTFLCMLICCYWLQEEGEEEGRLMRMGKRLLRSLSLVFGCIAVSSLVCNGVWLLLKHCICFSVFYCTMFVLKHQPKTFNNRKTKDKILQFGFTNAKQTVSSSNKYVIWNMSMYQIMEKAPDLFCYIDL